MTQVNFKKLTNVIVPIKNKRALLLLLLFLSLVGSGIIILSSAFFSFASPLVYAARAKYLLKDKLSMILILLLK
jgi:hypothetical protein